MHEVLYDKAVQWLNGRYKIIRNQVKNDRSIALYMYHECETAINFIWETDIIDFEDYNNLIDQHHNLFDDIFMG